MVWAGFCSRGALHLEFPDHRLDSRRYQEILRTRLLPPYRVLRRDGYIFQQDNAPCHTSRSTSAWLARQQVQVLDWPSNSPDLNPIENLWGIMVRQIYADNRSYQTKAELQAAIEQAWADIDEETIANLIGSMQNRLFQVINRNGGPTDY